MIGTTLSHYEVLDEIGRGGMGIVYRARDTRLNREVAVKVLPPELVADTDRRRRFVLEAQAAAALTHPHIAVVYEIGQEPMVCRSSPWSSSTAASSRRCSTGGRFPFAARSS